VVYEVNPAPSSSASSQDRVKQLNKRFKLLGSSGLQVLKHLGAGNKATDVAKMLKPPCTKANVTYWTKKLLKMGALQLQTKDVIKIYSLTPYGSKLLTRSEGDISESVCLEDYAVKFEVLERERRPIEWEKLGDPRNWEKLGVRIGGVRVVRTSVSVIIHPGKLKGFDTHELLMTSGRIVEWVKRILEDKFGMLLSDDGVELHKPTWRFYTPEAEEDLKFGTVITEGVGRTDDSPPEYRPHEEYDGEARAHARHLLPDSVKRVENKVDMINANLLKVTENLAALTESIGRLADSLSPLAGELSRAEGVKEPVNEPVKDFGGDPRDAYSR
jgi:hypothetical protein